MTQYKTSGNGPTVDFLVFHIPIKKPLSRERVFSCCLLIELVYIFISKMCFAF